MKKIRVGIIGLGYVGLPIAIILSKKFNVIGFDINKQRINELRKKKDITREIDLNKIKSKKFELTSNKDKIKDCNFYIITVPTPVSKNNHPDLSHLRNASQTVAKYLKKKDMVVYESTTYPGCTEEICIPILEKYSNLKLNKEFYCAYSPERINPGDKKHTIENIDKIISASSFEGLKIVQNVYKNVTKKKLVVAKSIKIAEGAKIIENTQRDINIALMNELSILFNKLNIDFSEVLKAANTKWNFLNFKPGLVGGHCIGVDPYYLAYKAKKVRFNPKVILSGRRTNENMYKYIISQLEKKIKKKNISSNKKKILILGSTFKENVPDYRNSQSIKIIKNLSKKKFKIYIFDPLVNIKELNCYTIKNYTELKSFKKYFDAILLLVPHKDIVNKGYMFFQKLNKKNSLFFDIGDTFKKNDFKL